MKNIIKLSVVALTVLSFAACDPATKPVTGGIDTPSTPKVDTSAKPGIDSAKTDAVKKDTTKK